MSKVINFADSQSELERQETAERLSRKQATQQVAAQKNGSDDTVHQESPKEKRHLLRKDLNKFFKEDNKLPFKLKVEFEKLIPPLSDSEFEILEENILAEGCREALIVWNGYLLDGHHRLSICLEHGLPFKTKVPEVELQDELDAKIWIARNQFGRRNLTDFERSVLALDIEKLLKEKAEKSSLKNLKQYKDQEVTEYAQVHTRKKTNAEKRRDSVDGQLSAIAGVSDHQIKRTRKILEKASPDDIAKLKSREKTIGKVYNEIKKKEYQETLATHQIPEGKYRVLYVDPPWKLESEPVASSKPDALGYYPRMTVDEITDIPIQDICEKNAALFLWAPPQFLPEALEIMKSWGFKYRSIFTWKKAKGTPGLYNKVDQEFLLVGEKGNCQPETDETVSSIHCINKKGASKPDEFRKIIEDLYSSTKNKVELYPRKKCAGWSQFDH